MSVKMRRRRSYSTGMGALLGLVALSGALGCEPAIKPEELGTPVYDESKLPGAGEAPKALDHEKPVE